MGVYDYVYIPLFNYYMPDFITAICLGFIFGFSFLDICFNLTQCQNKPFVEYSFLNRDQTLNLWSGSTDSKTLDYQRPNPQFSSVQFSRWVMSDSLRLHKSKHSSPPCLSPTPRIYWNSCPSSQWCHPAISSSVVPISSCPQSLPASGSLPMNQLFEWGCQSTGVSASA